MLCLKVRCFSPPTDWQVRYFECGLIRCAFHRKDSEALISIKGKWVWMQWKCIILHTLIIFVECIVMKRSSESVVWHVAAFSRSLTHTVFPIHPYRGEKHRFSFCPVLLNYCFPVEPSFVCHLPLRIFVSHSFPFLTIPKSLLAYGSFPVGDFQSVRCFPLRGNRKKREELDASLLSLPH